MKKSKFLIYILILFVTLTMYSQQFRIYENYYNTKINKIKITMLRNKIITVIKLNTKTVKVFSQVIGTIATGVHEINKTFDYVINKIRTPDFTKMKQATVQIKVGKLGGAGFIIKVDDKYLYILTAKHILINKGKISICVKDTKNRMSILEGISRDNIYVDDVLDMALIKLPKPEGEYTSFNFAKENPSIGTKIYTIGHPVGTHYTINEGIVSNYTKKSYMKKKGYYMLISAPAFNGNSGGAIVNRKTELVGMVVGITYLKYKRTTYFLHYMVFAVKLSDLKKLLKNYNEN